VRGKKCGSRGVCDGSSAEFVASLFVCVVGFSIKDNGLLVEKHLTVGCPLGRGGSLKKLWPPDPVHTLRKSCSSTLVSPHTSCCLRSPCPLRSTHSSTFHTWPHWELVRLCRPASCQFLVVCESDFYAVRGDSAQRASALGGARGGEPLWLRRDRNADPVCGNCLRFLYGAVRE
jgi:hypothetical protein